MIKTLERRRCHLFAGTPGQMTVHTDKSLYEGNILSIEGIKLKIIEILVTHKSNYLIGGTFYELKFDYVK